MNFKAAFAHARLPTLKNSLLAVLAAILLILAFPGFEFWFLAWFALVPLFYAAEREKDSPTKSFVLGWIFGTCFFFGSCWWLTYAPINYGGVPTPIAYFLLLMACLVVGLFPGVFAALFSLLLKRYGTWAIISAPFLWAAIEYLRFLVTGNNWNAVAYSQSFDVYLTPLASIGGIYLVSFICVLFNALYAQAVVLYNKVSALLAIIPPVILLILSVLNSHSNQPPFPDSGDTKVVAIQPNVPMKGLKYEDRQRLRTRHVELAESALRNIRQATDSTQRIIIIFPEPPMNFEYARDREFQQFLREFTAKNNVSVLFNAAEPAVGTGMYNSAVLVDETGVKTAQYDKIHLVPFGEYVPLPESLAQLVPTMVGNFQIGKSYELLPFDDLKAGVMICFESHFPNLTREFARQNADILVELTNDGYLGDTPVLRQHLANAVFRAVETNRPVVRVTNVGITAYIDENGKIYDATEPYTEDTRIWSVKKSNAPQTIYVKYGDWFAWVCSIISVLFLALGFRKRILKTRGLTKTPL